MRRTGFARLATRLNDDRRFEIDQIIVGIGEEGVPLMGTSPLRRRIRRRYELRDDFTRCAPSGLIKPIDIFPHGASCRRQLPPVDLISACKRALFIGVGCDQTGIDGEAFTTGEGLLTKATAVARPGSRELVGMPVRD